MPSKALPPLAGSVRKRVWQAALLAAASAVLAGADVYPQGPAPAAPEHIDGYRDTPLLPGGKWHVHDPDRPQPVVVASGTFSTPDMPGQPPSDAVVLFGGKDLSLWRDLKGNPPAWKLEDGVMISAGGDIVSVPQFGDAQIHVEFSTPAPPKGLSQSRGNSGVFLQGMYEVQVLDSYGSKTYPDGQAGAIYGQTPPLVNPTRAPGEWQVYDIAFTAARFGADGKLAAPAYATVFLNGVLVQNHTAILGPTGHRILARYQPGAPATGPLRLQFHGNSVRYRNVWVRPLAADERS